MSFTPEEYEKSIKESEELELNDPGIPLSCGDAIPLSEIIEALDYFVKTHTFHPKK